MTMANSDDLWPAKLTNGVTFVGPDGSPLIPVPADTSFGTPEGIHQHLMLINGQLAELRVMFNRVMPLVVQAEAFLAMSPMERLRAGLNKKH